MEVAIKLSEDFEGESEVTIIRVRRTTDPAANGPGVASRRIVETTAEPTTEWADVVPLRRVGGQ